MRSWRLAAHKVDCDLLELGLLLGRCTSCARPVLSVLGVVMPVRVRSVGS